MIKIIFKNLWHRRAQNGWLFAELIIVTILAWEIIDPVAVSISDRNEPLGYDADRLVNLSFISLPENAAEYKAEEADSASNVANSAKIARYLESLPEVESACFAGYDPILNSSSNSWEQLQSGNPAVDTLVKNIISVQYEPDSKFFETMGIESASGSPSPEELSRYNAGRREVIVTEDYARLFWPDENALGKKFVSVSRDGLDTTYTTIVGVVKGLRYQSILRSRCLIFNQDRYFDYNTDFDEFAYTVRLAPGVDPKQFVADFGPERRSQLSIGNFRLNKIATQQALINNVEFTYGVASNRKIKMILCSFFLINLILGTVGCFWLQTRRRVSETGVLRSFGALKSQIVKMLIGESVVLATTAFIIGDLLYLQYALKEGFDLGFVNNMALNVIDNWVSNFWEHFGIVSLIVYALIIICVIIGTLLPALKLSRINPVDALRDE